MKQSDIEAILSDAFISSPPPEGDALVEIRGDIYTREEIRDAFSGKRWQDLDQDTIESHDDALSFMAPEGRRYYLPAYLIATFNADPEWAFSDLVIYSLHLPLNRPEGDPIRTKFERFLELLTVEEKSAIRKFLEYTADRPGFEAAEEALHVLWNKF